MTSRRSSSCALCERSDVPSCCAGCVNSSLGEYHARLRSARSLRDSLHSRIAAHLEAKTKVHEQRSWTVSKAQDTKELRDRLSELTSQTAIEKKKVEQALSNLEEKTASLNLAFVMLKKKQADSVTMQENDMKKSQMGLMAVTSERLKRQPKAIKKLCRLFPMRQAVIDCEKKGDRSNPYDVICGVRLPHGLDPHSVPSEELSASLGYMLQVLNIVVPVLSAPALHVPGFGASCSRIWQRSSYWSTRQSRSKVYPLFVPRQNNSSVGEENSWTESSSGNFGVDSYKKSFFDSKRRDSLGNSSAASSHSVERHHDLQRGITLLKTSVTAITTYYYNSLGLDVPSNLSTFNAFTKMLHMLSSSKALGAALESNVSTRSENQAHQLKSSIWMASSAVSSNISLMNTTHTAIMPISLDNLLLDSSTSFLYAGKAAKHGRAPYSIVDGWVMVEREILPPSLLHGEFTTREVKTRKRHPKLLCRTNL